VELETSSHLGAEENNIRANLPSEKLAQPRLRERRPQKNEEMRTGTGLGELETLQTSRVLTPIGGGNCQPPPIKWSGETKSESPAELSKEENTKRDRAELKSPKKRKSAGQKRV